MSVLRYVGPFLFAISIPFFHTFAPAGPFLTVGLLLLALIGAEAISPRGAVPFASPDTASFRWLPNLYVPAQLTVIGWAVAVASHTTGAGFAALALSVGVTTGVFGMLAAHELVHGHSKVEHALGLAMLTGMTYRHFRVAHIFGHHRWAATDRDPATARLGESFYAFLVRTVLGQFTDAWRIETARITARRQPFLRHRIAGDVTAMAVVYIVIFALAGWRGDAMFAAQSAVGVIVLELFNYIAHYGLARAPLPKGHEPFGDRHSWNSSNVLANTMIFNMGRHSYHHTRPAASYQSLKWVSEAPELPAGYAGSILMALIPPLWRRIMDPAVQRLHTAPAAGAI